MDKTKLKEMYPPERMRATKELVTFLIDFVGRKKHPQKKYLLEVLNKWLETYEKQEECDEYLKLKKGRVLRLKSSAIGVTFTWLPTTSDEDIIFIDKLEEEE